MSLLISTAGAPPRDGLNPNRGFSEPGTFRAKMMRRLPHIEMFKWNSILDQIGADLESAKPKRDRMLLAHSYKALMDSGEFESRTARARHLGVSRGKVTQALRQSRSLLQLFSLRNYLLPPCATN